MVNRFMIIQWVFRPEAFGADGAGVGDSLKMCLDMISDICCFGCSLSTYFACKIPWPQIFHILIDLSFYIIGIASC